MTMRAKKSSIWSMNNDLNIVNNLQPHSSVDTYLANTPFTHMISAHANFDPQESGSFTLKPPKFVFNDSKSSQKSKNRKENQVWYKALKIINASVDFESIHKEKKKVLRGKKESNIQDVHKVKKALI